MAVQQGAAQGAAADIPRVLVVEDDFHTAGVIRRCLVRAGFAVELSTSGLEALRWVEAAWPDLVVLNPRLPGDGGTAFQRLRACADVPVVMVSPLADEHERTWGLQMGADDFVPNPLSLDELVARVRSVLRRVRAFAEPEPGGLLVAGSLELDEATRRVRVRGAWQALTALEFRLLHFLTSHPCQVFRREQLLEQVWGYTIGDMSTVTVHVRRLREKIEADAAHPRFIVTVWGVGYRLDPSGGRGDRRHG